MKNLNERRIEELEKENAQLKAHVERLRETVLSAKLQIPLEYSLHIELARAIDETPQYSLAKIQSDAVMKSLEQVDPNNELEDRVYSIIEEYAQSLLEGKDNETRD